MSWTLWSAERWASSICCVVKTLPFDAWFEGRLSELRGQPRQLMRAFKTIANSSRTARYEEADRLETEYFSELWCHDDHWKAVADLERGPR